jgi:hypothetical protein
MNRSTLNVKRRWNAPTRGSAILLALVLVLVLALVGLAVVSRASREGDAAAAKRNYDKAVSCADAAREMLLSKFSTFGVSPIYLNLTNTVDDKTMGTGHYDAVTVTNVTRAAGTATSTYGLSDLANRIGAGSGTGGDFYRMTLRCGTNVGGTLTNQSEVEYLVKFGL